MVTHRLSTLLACLSIFLFIPKWVQGELSPHDQDCCQCAHKRFSSSNSAYELWSKAKAAYEECRYEEAVLILSNAINDYDQADNFFLRLERAKMREMANDLKGAREDLYHVIQKCENLGIAPPYYLKALSGLMSICEPDECSLILECYSKIRQHGPNPPVYDIKDNVMIVSNLPHEIVTSRFREQIANIFCLAGFCRSSKDVTVTQDGKVRIQLHPCCEVPFSPQTANSDGCRNNCTSVSAFAYGACGRMPSWPCFVTCTAAVDMLRQACEWCCKNQNNWDYCAQRLRDFYPPPCDPAWD